MTLHPYVNAEPHQRWRSAMASAAPDDVDPVVSMPFKIRRSDRVATAGSCFAQHIGARLESGGFTRLVTESAHSIVPSATARELGYGTFTARFGNVYTARQMLQLLRRAYGRFTPSEPLWEGASGQVFDPFRPAIQPGGFANRRECEADRAQHLAAVRAMFESADVLLFTLGLTECWASRADGAVFPICPGVSAGDFSSERYAFMNFGVDEVSSDLRAFLSELRAVNPAIRFVLTVSPVPLAATAEPRHVWTSTTYSKAVLRVAAEMMTKEPNVAYFPSFEVVTSPSARGAYFDSDLRTVTPAGVDHVMRLFFKHMADGEYVNAVIVPVSPGAGDDFLQRAKAAMDVVCEEAALDQAFQHPVECDSRAVDSPLVSSAYEADPSANARQVKARNHAFARSPARVEGSPTAADPFPGFVGVPEIAASDLNASVLGGAILHHGCLLVRNLVDPAGVARLTWMLERAFEAAGAHLAGAPREQTRPWFDPFEFEVQGDMSDGGRTFVFQGGGVWTADAPPALEALIWELRRAGVVASVEEYLGEKVFLSVGKSTLRRVPPTSGTAWHQDGAFLGERIRTVNCWLSLSHCGVDAPGLDVYPRRSNALHERGTKGSPFAWSVGDGYVAELEAATGVTSVSPVFGPGDALLFDQLFLHRTGVRPGMIRDRLAIESWMFAGSTFPEEQIPLALDALDALSEAKRETC